MSSFNCERCGAPHIDTAGGYITGCLCGGNADERFCDMCGKGMKLINPDGWLRCAECAKKFKEPKQ